MRTSAASSKPALTMQILPFSKPNQEFTAPLRQLLQEPFRFEWTAKREESYQALLKILSDKTTHSGQIYTYTLSQMNEGRDWLPLCTRRRWGTHWSWWTTWTGCSQSQSRAGNPSLSGESQDKAWGMQMLRPYLVVKEFTSWGGGGRNEAVQGQVSQNQVPLHLHRRQVA